MKDPRILKCEACRESYGLNEARVRRALTTADPIQQERAKLCWVCAHLNISANLEPAKDAETFWRSLHA